MFDFGEIWAFPTDTSFGLGVRADDEAGLERLYALKKRPAGKFFSLVVRDFEMLERFAEIPEGVDTFFFMERPRTAILKPKKLLPQSKFWPRGQVAFRISTIGEIARNINFPVTATSANFSSEDPIFEVEELQRKLGDQIKIYDKIKKLHFSDPSEIWDFTQKIPKQIR
ncbi:Sua5/YciO/YrdC/YwlC family protein [Candidatus Gracilibacteria bacterium]|nr:Sua5/YciO/YrdC/YwlC family protein [Candidatus Gracilibacteria bacterium]